MKQFYLLILFSNLFWGCKKDLIVPEEINSNLSKSALLNFSGYQWQIRNTGNIISGPGGNYFSNKPAIVYIDGSGDLHLSIKKVGSKWRCSEIFLNETTGYGTYIFVTKGDLELYNEKIVVGLFTWDNYSFFSDANSELDIEFSQWGVPTIDEYLYFSVQPTRGGTYSERYYHASTNLMYDENAYSTHIIKWKPDEIVFESHLGDDTTIASLTHSFVFSDMNPGRTAIEAGEESDLIVIPTPQSDTRPHINFWLFDENGNGYGDIPTDHLTDELIIHRFEYIPY